MNENMDEDAVADVGLMSDAGDAVVGAEGGGGPGERDAQDEDEACSFTSGQTGCRMVKQIRVSRRSPKRGGRCVY